MICPHCKDEIDGAYIIHMSKAYVIFDKNNIILDVLDNEPIDGIIKARCPECGGEVTSRIEDHDGFFG